MASKIALTLETSDAHDAALAWLLKKANDQRDLDVLKSYPDVESLLTVMFLSALDNYLTQHQAAQTSCVAEAMLRATPDECAKIAEILKIEWP